MEVIQMRFKNILLLLFSFFITQSFAQTKDSSSFTGKKALMFSFNGFYLGGGLGGKYWVNNKQFITIQVNGNYQTDKSDRVLTDSTMVNADFKNSSITLSISLNNQLGSFDSFIPYFGVSLGYQWQSNDYYYNRLSGRTGSSNSQAGFIGSLSLGVEYFFSSRFSISGEQQVRMLLSKSNNELNHFVLSTSTSSLLLSIYL
jgi:hypothetical protein